MPPPVIPEPKPSEVLDLGNLPPGQTPPEPKPGETAKTKEPTKGEVEALQTFANTFLAKDGNALTPPKPKGKKKEEPEKPKENPPPAKPKVPAKPKAVAKPAAAPLTADQIAEATARGVTAAMTPKPGEGADKKPAAPAESELPAEEQEKISVLAQMEKQFPDKYKGLADKYKTSYQKLTEYAQKWEKDHPGEKFDDDAEEHKAFFEANDVDWEDNDYVKAMVKLSTDTALEAERRKTNEKLSEFERKEKLQEAAPQIFAEQVKADRNYWTQLGPEFADIIDEKGVINQAKLVEMQKTDPEGYKIRVAAAQDLRIETAAIYSLMNGLMKFDEKNPVHIAMGQFAADAEAQLAAKPAEDQLNADGKSFLSAYDYYKKPKAERERLYWTFNSTDLAAIRASTLAKETLEKVEAEEKRLQAWATARGLQPVKKGEEAPKPKVEKEAEVEDEPPPNPNEKPKSPSVDGESRGAALAGGKAKPDAVSKFANRFLGR